MSRLPNAEPSPRIVGGVVKWYYLDTFEIQLRLDLTDQDGEPVEILPGDIVKVVFFGPRGEVVKEFTSMDVEQNTVTLVFDEETTTLFERGQYTYDVYYTGENRTTIANDNKAVVE